MDPQQLGDGRLFRPEALDRFLNGQEPDAPLALNAFPWRTALVGALLLAATLVFWWWILGA